MLNIPSKTLEKVALMLFESGEPATKENRFRIILKYKLDGFEQLSKYAYLLDETGRTSGEVFT